MHEAIDSVRSRAHDKPESFDFAGDSDNDKKACPAETAAGHACFITAQKRRPKQSGGFEQEPKLLYRNLDFLACNQMKSNSPGGNRKTA